MLYLHYFYNAALRNYFTNLHKRGWGGPPSPPAQRVCNPESSVCTSTASSGSPGSSEAMHKVEQSESDCRSLKARGCSSSIMDAHSSSHHCGLISHLVLPCPHVMSLDGSLGFVSTHPSISLCSSPSGLSPSSSSPSGSTSSSGICSSSSSVEESSVQPRRWQVPSSTMRSTSSGFMAQIHQCYHHSLLHPAKIVGYPVGGDQLHLVPGGFVCQDAPFKNEGPHCT